MGHSKARACVMPRDIPKSFGHILQHDELQSGHSMAMSKALGVNLVSIICFWKYHDVIHEDF